MTQLRPNLARARRVLLAFAMVLAAILYIDRVCISQSQHLISADLGLSKKQMGLAFTVFGIAYGLSEWTSALFERATRPWIRLR